MPDVCHFTPAYVGLPDADHALATRRFQGISSLAITPGAFWATWYAGPTPGEDANNFDFDRTGARIIHLARFREEDILSGRADAPDVRLRQIISRVGDA